jgi:hypothetical protein
MDGPPIREESAEAKCEGTDVMIFEMVSPKFGKNIGVFCSKLLPVFLQNIVFLRKLEFFSPKKSQVPGWLMS